MCSLWDSPTRGSHLYVLCKSVCDQDQNWIERSKPFFESRSRDENNLWTEDQEHMVVSSPDLIRCAHRFQYTESDPHWGWFWVWDWDRLEHMAANWPLTCLKIKQSRASKENNKHSFCWSKISILVTNTSNRRHTSDYHMPWLALL